MDARRLEGQIERGTAEQKEALDAALGAQPLGPAGVIPHWPGLGIVGCMATFLWSGEGVWLLGYRGDREGASVMNDPSMVVPGHQGGL